ncbi:MAG: DedA family protein [Clostridia bacterium]|jgi:membrane protein DedA with SNARE-associated domain
MHVLTQLADSIVALGVVGVLIGMFLESAAIPIPSEVILPYAGYLVAIGRAGWIEAGVAAMLGGLLGSIASYVVAFYGGRALFSPLIRRHELDRAEVWFRRYGDRAVFFGRLVPGVRTYISLPAGLTAMPFGRFVLYSVLGALPWTVVFMILGYQGGRNWARAAHFEHWVVIIGALIVVGWIVWFVARRRRHAM